MLHVQYLVLVETTGTETETMQQEYSHDSLK